MQTQDQVNDFAGIITKGGDTGQTHTGVFGRVYKNHIAVELVGTLDELEVQIGELRLHTSLHMSQRLRSIQAQLKRCMGAIIMDTGDEPDMESLEKWCEELMPDELPSQFTYPGDRNDGEVVAHRCRVVARRSERVMVSFLQGMNMKMEYNLAMREWQKFLNRISDFFYLMTL